MALVLKFGVLQCLKNDHNFYFGLLFSSYNLMSLIFLRSTREANFELYINSLSNLVPWFFALNHYNYARWLSVHLRDMLILKDDHPLIAKEFSASKFVVTKTQGKFSKSALDHAHEQNNDIVKDDGGAVGLTGIHVLCSGGLWLSLKWPRYATILMTLLNA